MENRRGTTKSKGKKEINDKFYTKPEIAKELIKEVNLEEYDLIIEPSAGNGSFSKQIPNCKAYDIEPESEEIEKADWLKLDKSQFKGKILVIGNPPFGTNNNLAIEFINESAKIAEEIAFILPRTFRKPSVQDRINLNFSLIKDIDLADKSYLLNEEEYSVPTIFQIWKRTNTPREKTKRISKSGYFEFVDKSQADLRIQRVGGNAGTSDKNFNLASESNYFIKLTTDKITVDNFIELVNNTHFPTVEYTVGPKSLSKTELITEIEKKIKGKF